MTTATAQKMLTVSCRVDVQDVRHPKNPTRTTFEVRGDLVDEFGRYLDDAGVVPTVTVVDVFTPNLSVDDWAFWLGSPTLATMSPAGLQGRCDVPTFVVGERPANLIGDPNDLEVGIIDLRWAGVDADLAELATDAWRERVEEINAR